MKLRTKENSDIILGPVLDKSFNAKLKKIQRHTRFPFLALKCTFCSLLIIIIIYLDTLQKSL